MDECAKENLRKLYLGKTYEELYGEEKAKIMKEKSRIAHSGSKNPFYGKKQSSESIEKSREWHKNNPEQTRKTLEKMWESNRGKKQSAETIRKRVEKNTGKKRTEELKQRMREINKGQKLTQEQHNKMINNFREKVLGKTYEERFGKEKAEEIGKKLSSANKGKEKTFGGKPYRGSIHHAWIGGVSFEPYTFEFTEKFRNSIKKRDEYSCQICNLKETRNKYLHIHHINYDKKLSIPQNCISLCERCHGFTNFNRNIWCAFFQSMLSERYGYDYEDKKVVITLDRWSNGN